ncbi:hypothetical protein P261_00349 [Lachnospiraceae bacterium TWA4]|nr:hypothetical protein P261_00349 [Lachnospiraceae bacterium TWA4]
MAEEEKSDLVKYVESNKDVSFEEKPFNSADGLVLAELAYIDWSDLGLDYPSNPNSKDMTLKDVLDFFMTNFPEKFDALKNKKNPDKPSAIQELIKAIVSGANTRFGNIKVSNFYQTKKTYKDVDGLEKLEQFAALIFTYTDENGKIQNFIAYRGTDGTLEGWCEDFNMAYDTMTESQIRAVEYLNIVSKYLEGDIKLGGHSKGGNNALYAYLFCNKEVRDRINKLYNYDGPGFVDGIHYEDSNGNDVSLDLEIYKQMIKLLEGTAIAPFDSIIGQLLNENEFTFVDTNTGILMDHDGFSWKINPETGEFITKEQSNLSKYMNETLDDWLASLSMEHRKVFMTVLWEWIYSTGVEDFEGIGGRFKENPILTSSSLVKHINELSESEKEKFLSAAEALLVYFVFDAINNNEVREQIKQKLEGLGIKNIDDLSKYIEKDPIKNTVNLMQEILSNQMVLKEFIKLKIAEKLVKFIQLTLLNPIIAVLKKFNVENLSKLAVVIAVIAIVYLAIKFIEEKWKAFTEDIAKMQEKISQFVNDMTIKITNELKSFINSLVQTAQHIAEKIGIFVNEMKNFFKQLGALIVVMAMQAMKMCNPFLYSLVRSIMGFLQSPVSIDMKRLQEAVDQMQRLANRVANMDYRLDNLYRHLCENNIEQEEGVFTSLVNKYQLSRADMNVDQGEKIKKKAEAVSKLFKGYNDTEKWVLSQV